MAKIVGMLGPFNPTQTLIVYENGQKLAVVEANMDNLYDTVFSLIDTYEVDQIDLTGPKNFSRGISRRIEEAEMEKYSYNKVKINII